MNYKITLATLVLGLIGVSSVHADAVNNSASPSATSGQSRSASATDQADGSPDTEISAGADVADAGNSGEPASEKKDPRLNEVRAAMVVKVISPDKVRGVFEQMVKKRGGYVTQVTKERIVFKLPPEKLIPVIDKLSEDRVVLNKTIHRRDRTNEIAQMKGRLKSQMEILAKLRTFFDGADLYSTLDIERSMSRLVLEIERLKGQLRKADDQVNWSVLDISFEFQPEDKVVYVQSPFEWLNTANLEVFLEDF